MSPSLLDANSTTTLSPGGLVDLGEHCPERCVTWDEANVCWGLVRTNGKPRRPETVPYRIVAPVDDDEAWILGRGHDPALAPAGASPPPRPPVRTAVATDPADPVDMARAVFGDEVEVVATAEDMGRLVGQLLAQRRRRDPSVLEDPAWQALAAAGQQDGSALAGAVRGILDWCAEHEPDRMGLGGWKHLAGMVEAFEGGRGEPGVTLLRWRCECPEEERLPGKPCRQMYHTT